MSMVITNIKSILIATVAVSWCLVLSGCATAPIQEMSDARQSLQAAQEAGADRYAASTLSRAQMALEQAERKLEDRAFKEARLNAVAAKAEAMDAQEIAFAISEARNAVADAMKKGSVSSETESLLQQAEQAASRGDKLEAVSLANEAKLKVLAP